MKEDSVDEKAARFIAEYQKLKEKKGLEKFLGLIKQVILSSKQDNITDKEIIDIIRSLGFKEKLYPAKFNELRKQLNSDKVSDANEDRGSDNDGDQPPASGDEIEHSDAAAPSHISDALNGVGHTEMVE